MPMTLLKNPVIHQRTTRRSQLRLKRTPPLKKFAAELTTRIDSKYKENTSKNCIKRKQPVKEALEELGSHTLVPEDEGTEDVSIL